jgi:hypothetical protein
MNVRRSIVIIAGVLVVTAATVTVVRIADSSDEAHAATQLGGADFNGDGLPDLAIAVPKTTVNGHHDAGAVHVVYGSPIGIDASKGQLWSQATTGIVGNPETGDGFGGRAEPWRADLWDQKSIAAGDFDGDGYDDLAVGVPGEDMTLDSDLLEVPGTEGHGTDTVPDAGAVNVIRGSVHGLTADGNVRVTAVDPGFGDVPSANAGFGSTLAVGDINGDKYDDLVVGAPFQTVGHGVVNEGTQSVLYVIEGSAGGLEGGAHRTLNGTTSGVLPIPDGGSSGLVFASHFALGDVDDDGYDDVVVCGHADDATQVGLAVLAGSADGLSTDDGHMLEAPDDICRGDVVVADVTGDGVSDVIAAAGEGVIEYDGSRSGVAREPSTEWEIPAAAGVAVGSDVVLLAPGDVDGDGFTDMAVSVGAASVAWAAGSSDGLSGSMASGWHEGPRIRSLSSVPASNGSVTLIGGSTGVIVISGGADGPRTSDPAILTARLMRQAQHVGGSYDVAHAAVGDDGYGSALTRS